MACSGSAVPVACFGDCPDNARCRRWRYIAGSAPVGRMSEVGSESEWWASGWVILNPLLVHYTIKQYDVGGESRLVIGLNHLERLLGPLARSSLFPPAILAANPGCTTWLQNPSNIQFTPNTKPPQFQPNPHSGPPCIIVVAPDSTKSNEPNFVSIAGPFHLDGGRREQGPQNTPQHA